MRRTDVPRLRWFRRQNKKDLIIKKQSKAAPEYGEVITSVCCYDGKIYTFENCGESGEIKSYVCSYDTTGKLLKKTPIKEITDFFEKNPNDTVFAISIFENHVIFQTLNGWLLGFKKTESGYEQIDVLCGENLRLANTSEKINCNMKNIVLSADVLRVKQEK